MKSSFFWQYFLLKKKPTKQLMFDNLLYQGVSLPPSPRVKSTSFIFTSSSFSLPQAKSNKQQSKDSIWRIKGVKTIRKGDGYHY